MKILRHYQEEDKNILYEMGKEEGFTNLEMKFEDHPTMVLEENGKVIGFFTLKTAHKFPMLQHFCIKKENRNVRNAFFLLKCFKKVIKELGFTKVIMFSDRESLRKMIEWAFHVKPYAETKGLLWYLVKFQEG